ncbi:Tim44/TimA family putative adaptor protein [Algicella marina]|uniref:Tim44/TimA family putative adaptor protein n=1 Tax=Algicella marina TaxID=2683284 RepID=A0A6P1T4G2_9RHOB|nr:Tim44/TimA family putative adaptor protein [Algicella marina]QHQ36590.1 Tim44/TimA family putative adaptor protein [Algicella marina]
MGSQLIQILVLAGVALFLVLRLRDVLGTRDGFEPTTQPKSVSTESKDKRGFEVIDGGGTDPDIADHVDPESDAGKAFAAMKRVEPDFSVSEFAHGARQAYEIILMAYENGELDTLEQFLAPEVYEPFSAAVFERADKQLTVEANFVGIREMKIIDAAFDNETREGDITIRYVGELTSVVKNAEGEVVEGDKNEIKKQKDEWTFSRVMGSDDPNWRLVATGG